MGRYTGPSCRLCRREGQRLFLKGDKCFSGKCVFTKKPKVNTPSKRQSKPTEYALQLREKQKVKRYYGLLEKQFRNYYETASNHKGVTGEIMLQLLERRLDNLLYKSGFAASRKESRQIVNHGHVKVNGKKVDIPSYLLKAGDEIQLSEKIMKNPQVQDNISKIQNKTIPEWLEVTEDKGKSVVKEIPQRSELGLEIDVNEQLIVELYSK